MLGPDFMSTKPGGGKAKRFAATLELAALAFALYLAEAAPLRHWIADDAGVSFAYARSLASGLGLVSQPGAAHVEGYSNFAWVVLLAGAVKAHAFDPVWTPKIVSAALVLLTLVTLGVVLARAGAGRLAAALALLLVATNPSTVVWSMSGMANALYGLMAVLFVVALASRRRGAPYAAGVAAALLGMTRIEGAAFGVVLPLWPLFAARVSDGAPPRSWSRAARATLTFAGVYGAYTAFRVLYFGRWVPPLVGAPLKHGDALSADAIAHKLFLSKDAAWSLAGLSHAAFGIAGAWILVMSSGLFAVAWWRRQLARETAALWSVLIAAACVYVLMPPDWMGEYRFGTPFMVLAAPAVLGLAGASAERLAWPRLRRGLVAAAIVASASFDFVARARAFAADPIVPFAEIARRARTVAAWARDAGVRGRTYLCADAGGTLWDAELELVDLGGLTDPVIARTLEHHEKEFFDYVLAVRRPALIELHGYWTKRARLYADPRFSSDYVPLVVFDDPWLKRAGAPTTVSGVYARRDLVDPAKVRRTQERLARWSPRELALQLGLDPKYVGRPRAQLAGASPAQPGAASSARR
jgi:hypothetical protein